jgi:hypothetical protein
MTWAIPSVTIYHRSGLSEKGRCHQHGWRNGGGKHVKVIFLEPIFTLPKSAAFPARVDPSVL